MFGVKIRVFSVKESIYVGLSMERVFFWFQLNSNMLNISFGMGMFSNQN